MINEERGFLINYMNNVL